MATAQKPKTNWHLVIWPIAAVWIGLAVYVFRSDWRDSAAVSLPIFMAASAFVVFLLNAVAGSIAQRRWELSALDEATTECSVCRKTEVPLHIVDYHWYLFLGAIVVQFGGAGKFCVPCAKSRVDSFFRKTLWGSIFCPPITLWAWVQRKKILTKIGQ